MNSGLPEMLHCLTGGGGLFTLLNHDDQGIGDIVGRAIKPDPGFVNGWGDDLDRIVLNCRNGSNFEMGYAPAAEVADTAAEFSSPTGNSNSKKRKLDKAQTFKVVTEGNSEGKKIKVCAEEESNKSTTTTTGSSDTNKKSPKGPSNSNSKASDLPKPDYIHVRARRGQATDSHSLAERVRREKISERMKYLQDLVPGCNKITGKAGMLDEIINYVQSLQRQVEFLSMKLAAMNPTVDFDIDSYVTKEITQIFPACLASFPASAHLQFNSLVPGVSGTTPEMGAMNPTDAILRRATTPVSMLDTFLESPCLNQIQNLSCEDELQNLFCMEYQQGRPAAFTSQTFTGLLEAGNVKLEM